MLFDECVYLYIEAGISVGWWSLRLENPYPASTLAASR